MVQWCGGVSKLVLVSAAVVARSMGFTGCKAGCFDRDRSDSHTSGGLLGCGEGLKTYCHENAEGSQIFSAVHRIVGLVVVFAVVLVVLMVVVVVVVVVVLVVVVVVTERWWWFWWWRCGGGGGEVLVVVLVFAGVSSTLSWLSFWSWSSLCAVEL